ncbi:MAG TPA: MFS transporter [Bryobacteraceae bacterium]|nr:MFS transporter [Bryobacteraceae bacterium]
MSKARARRAEPAEGASDHRAAVVASFLGWMLDAFDFFLLVMCLTAIGREFHKSDAEMAVTLSVTLAFRPVGAFIFGLMADRYGRRLPFILVLVFYSVMEVLSGLAPNYASFVALRALFGIGMGGEWGVGASLAMEKTPPRLRGLISGILQQGYSAGYLLAALCYFLLFSRVGWRPLFFLGGAPALLALFVGFRVKESEVWEKTRHQDWRDVGRAVLSNWKLFLYIAALMTGMNLASHGTQDLFPTLLERTWHFDPAARATLTAFSMVGAVCGGTLFGLMSDRWGRRRAMVVGLLAAVPAVPLWTFAPSVAWLYVGSFAIQFLVQGAWGVTPAHLAELSPDSLRGFLPGFGYQCGVALASAAPYLEAVIAKRAGYATAMAEVAACVFVLAAALAAAGRERKAVKFGE